MDIVEIVEMVEMMEIMEIMDCPDDAVSFLRKAVMSVMSRDK